MGSGTVARAAANLPTTARSMNMTPVMYHATRDATYRANKQKHKYRAGVVPGFLNWDLKIT